MDNQPSDAQRPPLILVTNNDGPVLDGRHRLDAWADVAQLAEIQRATIDEDLAAHCRILGIPDEFRPRVTLTWAQQFGNN